MVDNLSNDNSVEITDTKEWYKSKTIWGAIVTFICAVLTAFHVQLPDDVQTQIVDLLTQFGTVVGAAIVVYGRVVASKTIVVKKQGEEQK